MRARSTRSCCSRWRPSCSTRAGLDWRQIDRLAVGVGPGRLHRPSDRPRDGARDRAVERRRAGRCRHAAALAEPVAGRAAAAVLDARRGEAFVAVYRDGEELLAPRACRPEEIAALALTGGPADARDRRRGASASASRSSAAASSVRAGGKRPAPAERCRDLPARRRRERSAPRTRTTCGSPTRRSRSGHRRDERAGATRDPPARLRRPARRRRDRAARLPDAVVDRDVRARAVQADRDLPRGAARRSRSSATRSARATTPSGT